MFSIYVLHYRSILLPNIILTTMLIRFHTPTDPVRFFCLFVVSLCSVLHIHFHFSIPFLFSFCHVQHFTSKLSLPKFITVAQSINPKQRELVKSIGFHHLLDLSCKTLPKSIILWLARHFDVATTSLFLPNGYFFKISAYQIHQVLGIPIGGSPLPSFCDTKIKNLISEQTKCAGKYPTINELSSLIKDGLDDDKFKMVFALFAITTLLCPTSSDCASPDFFPAVHIPNKIISYNWCHIVLDKLVSSIAKFQQSTLSHGTAALGGCQFALMVRVPFSS